MKFRDRISGKPWKTLAKSNERTMPQGVSRVRTGKMAVFQSFPNFSILTQE